LRFEGSWKSGFGLTSENNDLGEILIRCRGRGAAT